MELTPIVFRAAAAGDAVARAIVDRQADEIVRMSGVALRRLHMTKLDVEVVLGGGVFSAGDEDFIGRIGSGLVEVAGRARVRVLDEPPVVGAALLGLDAIRRDRRRCGVPARLSRRHVSARAGDPSQKTSQNAKELGRDDGMAKIVFDGVTKEFGDEVVAVDDALEIADGEFMVLVGPSGCGKSTTCGCSPGSRRSRRARSGSTTRRSPISPRRSGTSRWCSRTTPCIRT